VILPKNDHRVIYLYNNSTRHDILMSCRVELWHLSATLNIAVMYFDYIYYVKIYYIMG